MHILYKIILDSKVLNNQLLGIKGNLELGNYSTDFILGNKILDN